MDGCESNPEQNCAGKFNYIIPVEGTIRWMDNLAMPKDAPHPELALAFMDYILDAQVGAEISNYTAYLTPNQKAIDEALIDEALLSNPSVYPDEEVSERLFDVSDLGEATRLYNDAWTELKTLLGQ